MKGRRRAHAVRHRAPATSGVLADDGTLLGEVCAADSKMRQL